jgi:hypothetical protein
MTPAAWTVQGEGLQLRIPERMMFTRIVLTVAVVICTLLTYNLWAGPRTFPKTSLWPVNPDRTVESVIYFAALACLLGSMFFRWQRVLVACGVVMLLYLASCDINRVQPWFFVYVSMLLVFVFYNGRVDDPSHYTALFIVLQLMFVAVYIAVGLDLLRDAQLADRVRSLAHPLTGYLSERQFNGLLKLAPVLPWFVFLASAGLVYPPMRFLAIAVSAGFHIILLWFQFPHEQAGWAPWFKNVVFLFILPFLFSGRTRERYFDVGALFATPLFYYTIVMFYVAPIAGEFSSATLSLPRMPWTSIDHATEVIVTDPLRQPYHLRTYCAGKPGGRCVLDYEAWFNYELHGTIYPSPHAIQSVVDYVRIADPAAGARRRADG